MARVPFIAGNWKLNHGPKAAAALAMGLRDSLANRGDATLAVFPTALSIPAVLPILEGTGIHVGVQEINASQHGAFTGTNSAEMARELGCTYALIGHSERRQLFGETDADVRVKIDAAREAGLLPMVCIGETLQEREAGRVEEVVFRQLSAAFEGIEADVAATITIAYEPVWAIGTGVTATPAQAQEVHAKLRGWLATHYPAFVAEQTRILYGGSVKPDNAAELMSCPDIDGALVGGASLKAADFAGIVAGAVA
ncbi:MAG: triose-phosphate isomerase [Alphaproteobacteria bacterium]|nr:triose-phosphate isomerase [Alphaproteobacteria bacterium]